MEPPLLTKSKIRISQRTVSQETACKSGSPNEGRIACLDTRPGLAGRLQKQRRASPRTAIENPAAVRIVAWTFIMVIVVTVSLLVVPANTDAYALIDKLWDKFLMLLTGLLAGIGLAGKPK